MTLQSASSSSSSTLKLELCFCRDKCKSLCKPTQRGVLRGLDRLESCMKKTQQMARVHQRSRGAKAEPGSTFCCNATSPSKALCRPITCTQAHIPGQLLCSVNGTSCTCSYNSYNFKLLFNNLKPKDIQFTLMQDKEKFSHLALLLEKELKRLSQ